MSEFSIDGVPIQASSTADGAPLLPAYVARKPANTIEVFDQDDFGVFSGDEVVLQDLTIYLIMAPFVLSKGGLCLPPGSNIEIQGTGQLINTITYVNPNKAFLSSTGAGTLTIRSISVNFNSPTQELFDLIGNSSGPLQIFEMSAFSIASAGIGMIEGFIGSIINNPAFIGAPVWGGGLTFLDVTATVQTLVITNQAQISSPLVSVQTTAPNVIEFFNCRIEPRGTDAAFFIDSVTQDAASRVSVRELISGPEGVLFDAAGLDHTDPRVISNDNFGRPSSDIAAEGNADNNVVNTVIPATDAWVLSNVGTMVFEEENRIVGSPDGVFEYIALEPNMIKTDGNVTMQPNNSNKLLAASYSKICAPVTPITFDGATDTFVAAGLINGDAIIFYDTPGTLPVGLRPDIIYFVVNGNQLSYTSGGAPVNFVGTGTPPNELKKVEFHGSRSPNQITAGDPLDVVVQSLVVMDTGDKMGQFVMNKDDGVDILVSNAYTRVFNS